MKRDLTPTKARLAKRLIIAVAAIGLTVTSATAGEPGFWHNISVGYHRNNAWPEPFTEVDAMEVMRPFEIMKHNGWRLHNTIGHELFREGDGVLLASGNMRIHWISSQAPPTRRDIYVLRGRSPEETEARLASVRQTLASLNLQGNQPRVMITDVEPGTSSGAWATKVAREWLSSLPKPQLPRKSVTGEDSVATPSGKD